MEVIRFTPQIALIDLDPPIPGFDHFLTSYVIQSDKIALIDVGTATSLENFFGGLRELQIPVEKVDYILMSHIHLDHNGGLGGAFRRMPKAVGIVHEKGKPHLVNPQKLWEGSLNTLQELARGYGAPEPVPEDRLVSAHDGMEVDLGGTRVEIIITPGHASHHLSFFMPREGTLFAGEAAGVYSPEIDVLRPASPIPFSLKQTVESLEKLMALNPRDMYYAHFGHTTDPLGQMKRYHRQLTIWSRIIARHLDNSVNWQGIAGELKAEDESIRGIWTLPPDKLKRELGFVRNNINGFVDYFKRNGTQGYD